MLKYIKTCNGYTHVTYGDLRNNVLKLASFLKSINVKHQDKIFICSENRAEWAVIDFAILSLGAVDIPKGSDVTLFEAEIIFNSALPSVVVLENLNLLNMFVTN